MQFSQVLILFLIIKSWHKFPCFVQLIFCFFSNSLWLIKFFQVLSSSLKYFNYLIILISFNFCLFGTSGVLVVFQTPTIPAPVPVEILGALENFYAATTNCGVDGKNSPSTLWCPSRNFQVPQIFQQGLELWGFGKHQER